MIEEMSELVQKSQRGASADARHAKIDRISLAKSVRAGLADRRGRSYRNRFEIRSKRVEARRCSKRTTKLRRERTSPRQRDHVFQRTQPRLAFARDTTWIPALSHG